MNDQQAAKTSTFAERYGWIGGVILVALIVSYYAGWVGVHQLASWAMGLFAVCLIAAWAWARFRHRSGL